MVPIAKIEIGPRRREKLTRVKTLARSIGTHGLIHPILLRGHELVAGHRRLEACRSLGWKSIPARQVEKLTDDEFRAIEVDENVARENLTDYETSAARLALIRQTAADLKAKDVSVRTPNGNSTRGRTEGRPQGKTAGSRRAVADAIGIAPATQIDTERHVNIGERYPFVRHAGWGISHAFDAAAVLDQIPEQDRPPIAALFDQPGIPPEKALPMLQHAAELSKEGRQSVIALAQHPDPFERRRALTALAQLPTPADPALLSLSEMVRFGRKATKLCRTRCFQPRLAALTQQADELYAEFRAANQKERTNAEVIN